MRGVLTVVAFTLALGVAFALAFGVRFALPRGLFGAAMLGRRRRSKLASTLVV